MNKVFRSIVYASILILFVGFYGCSSKSNDTIGLLLHDMEGRWFTDLEYLQKHASDAGVKLIVKVADGNEKKQLEQAQELVREGVGVMLVVAVNQNTAAGIVRTAHKSNLEVIAYDRIIMNSELDYFISYDYQKLGAMLVEYAYKKVPRGNYVLLYGGSTDNNAQMMKLGQENFLAPFIENGDINAVYRTYTENWDEKNAAERLARVLDFTTEPIDAVIASNDNIAIAALEVFDQKNVKQPKVITGQDAIIEACQSIMNDKQTMTVYKSTNSMAREAISLAVDVMKKQKSTRDFGQTFNGRHNVPTLYLEPQVVDKSNLIEIITGDGMYTMSEIMDQE
jgi:D-xylose transport system substrate-binding protein